MVALKLTSPPRIRNEKLSDCVATIVIGATHRLSRIAWRLHNPI
jgi:hypothetical protein